MTQFYAPDVISVGEGEGIYIGRDQIRPLYQEVVKNNKVQGRLDLHASSTAMPAGTGRTFTCIPTDGKTEPFTFAILFLWARIDGQWWCKGDFFVTGSLKTGKLAPSPAAGSK